MKLEMENMVQTITKTKEDQKDKKTKTCRGIQTREIQQPGKTIIWIDANIQIIHLF